MNRHSAEHQDKVSEQVRRLIREERAYRDRWALEEGSEGERMRVMRGLRWRFFIGDSTNKIKLKDEGATKFVLGVLNSQLMDWFFRKTSTNNHVNNYELDKLPIPNATPKQQQVLAGKVEKILVAKAADPAADVSALEREIDVLVADLYGLDADERELVGIV